MGLFVDMKIADGIRDEAGATRIESGTAVLRIASVGWWQTNRSLLQGQTLTNRYFVFVGSIIGEYWHARKHDHVSLSNTAARKYCRA